ncbi:MAG: hypothetical protein GC149_01540 [Gammaproteobacteria bacterium]|nr:hypothetical protein [Gammaproteobacteria bacterium]
MAKILALVSLVIVLGLVNWSIVKKEDQLAHGKIAYLELAPIDPRSLMQGDYMALNYQVARQVYDALPKSKEYKRWRQNIDASDGYAVVALDERNIATFKSIYHGQALAKNDILMRYRVRNGAVRFATNAYFFQEGTAGKYQTARYGQFRVADDGELLLVAMYDKDLKKLGGNEF